MDNLRGELRRRLPALMLVIFVVWIIVIVVLITADPTPGTGNPMD